MYTYIGKKPRKKTKSPHWKLRTEGISLSLRDFAGVLVLKCKIQAIDESQLGLALPWPVLALFTLALLALCSVTQCVPLTRPGGSCYCAGPVLLQ